MTIERFMDSMQIVKINLIRRVTLVTRDFNAIEIDSESRSSIYLLNY